MQITGSYSSSEIASTAKAAAVYALTAFALGFTFGLVRTFLLGQFPDVTRLGAVVVEIIIMLPALWLACRWVIDRLSIKNELGYRVVMAVFFLFLLLLAEFIFSTTFFDRTVAEHFALYGQLSFALGLVAQILSALFPILQMKRDVTARIAE